jgi:hypothetical protein
MKGIIFLGTKKQTDFSEGTKNISLNIVANFSKCGLSTELENIKVYEEGLNTKPEDIRYIILGKKKPDSEFMELKVLCTNAHWIHAEEVLFYGGTQIVTLILSAAILMIQNIRKITEIVMEHNDRTMLLVAEPEMGKSTFLSHMEHEIKKRNTAVWVLRINLNEHTCALENIEFEEECIDKCKVFFCGVLLIPLNRLVYICYKKFSYKLWSRKEKWL